MEQSVDNNKSENSNVTLLNYKEDERHLSESLFRNLHVMQRFHDPTPEFLHVFEPHMFIKSNPKAFPQVIHYIFNCLDPVEFNKRFLWPIDKAGETRFRNSTLDYMNHLNITHQLGLETLKLSNIHIPGGLKFIKVIHKFAHLIMKEEIRKRSHGPLPSLHHIPDANEQLLKLEELVDQGMDFVTRLQVQSDKLVDKIDAMNKMMEPFFEESNQKERCLTCLAKEWRDELDIVAKEEVAPQLERINVFSKQSIELNELLTKLFVDRKENAVQYDKNKLVVVQHILKKMNPDLDQAIDGMVEGNFINFDHLFQVFSYVLPKLMDKVEKFIYRDLEAIQFESDEVATLHTRASTLQAEVNDFEKSLLPFVKMNEEKIRTFYLNNDNAPFMIMQTPPISRRCQINRMNNRLALMDENVSQTKLFKEPSMRRTALKNTCLSKSMLSQTTNNLRSQNAALGIISKSKTRGHSLNISGISKFSTPKFSSTMCSSVGTVGNNNKKSHTELKFSTVYPMTPTHVFSENVTETTSVVSPNAIAVMRKVSTNSVYHFNKAKDSPHTRSPTRHFHVADLPINFITTIQPNGHQEEENAVETTGVQNIIAAMNAARIDTDEFIANVSDTLLNDVSITD